MDPDLTSKVKTRQDLAVFVEMLRRDLRERGQEWENPDLDSFLEAFGAWLEQAEGFYRHRRIDPSSVSPWTFVADALAAARVYE